jgi:hypothetical protein
LIASIKIAANLSLLEVFKKVNKSSKEQELSNFKIEEKLLDKEESSNSFALINILGISLSMRLLKIETKECVLPEPPEP